MRKSNQHIKILILLKIIKIMLNKTFKKLKIIKSMYHNKY